MKDENEKCVSCIKSGNKFCLYGDGLNKCCDINDFSPHCQKNCSNQMQQNLIFLYTLYQSALYYSDQNSLYSQYRVCPQRESACGERYLIANHDEQFMTSTPGYYHVNITCVYHIDNPMPDHLLYFTIFRKTNDSELGLYFIEEHSDGLIEYSTIVYELPKHNIYSGLETDDFTKGEPYHNSSDVMKRYEFTKIRRLNVVTLGKSDSSQFDFSVSLSILSSSTWDLLIYGSYITVGSILGFTFLYVVIKELVVALKKRSHSNLQEEIDEDQQQQDQIDKSANKFEEDKHNQQ